MPSMLYLTQSTLSVAKLHGIEDDLRGVLQMAERFPPRAEGTDVGSTRGAHVAKRSLARDSTQRSIAICSTTPGERAVGANSGAGAGCSSSSIMIGSGWDCSGESFRRRAN